MGSQPGRKPQGSSGPPEWTQERTQEWVTPGWASSLRDGEQGEMGRGRKMVAESQVSLGHGRRQSRSPRRGLSLPHPQPFKRHLHPDIKS